MKTAKDFPITYDSLLDLVEAIMTGKVDPKAEACIIYDSRPEEKKFYIENRGELIRPFEEVILEGVLEDLSDRLYKIYCFSGKGSFQKNERPG